MGTSNIIREKIIKDYDRLGAEDTFKFSCHPGISCFNKCCSDVNIFLTPYDIVRLKNRLGIKSGEFLDKYTILPLEEHLKYPVVMLRMSEETLSCPFVGPQGCTVYEDRPWACRMYPVGVASPDEKTAKTEDKFYFLLQEEVCKGFEEGNEWSIAQWLEDQKTAEYDEIGELFKELTLHPHFIKGRPTEPVKLEMFFMTCYNIDKFRSFVFESSFLKRFKLEPEVIEKIAKDDTELLKIGFKWLRFSIFGEKSLEISPEYINI
jgi:hypothetical protein